jgi:DNA ligase (NAD+)
MEFLDWARGAGLPLPGHTTLVETVDEVWGVVERFTEKRHSLSFEVDGVVVKVEDLCQRTILGFTSRAPRWAIACKMAPVEQSTTAEGHRGELWPDRKGHTVGRPGSSDHR